MPSRRGGCSSGGEWRPVVSGRTMAESSLGCAARWRLRRLLMLEPRGHSGMHGAMLTEPASPNAHAGVRLCMEPDFRGVRRRHYRRGHDCPREQLIHGVDEHVLIDTPVGLFRTYPKAADAHIWNVSVTGALVRPHRGVALRIGHATSAWTSHSEESFTRLPTAKRSASPSTWQMRGARAHGTRIKEAIDATAPIGIR